MKNLTLLALVAMFFACTPKQPDPYTLLPEKDFDTVAYGGKISLYTLKNKNQMAVQLSNYGARIVSIWVPAKDGSFKDVVWGFPTIKGYFEASDKNSGPVVGRFGNRIAKGKFSIDGEEFKVDINNGPNHLHGGAGGFSTRVWNATATSDSTVVMSYNSADGEEGYPGNLNIYVTYTLTYDNALKLDYKVTTEAPTIVNPTSHAYFNLTGNANTDINSHILQINADSFLPTDSTLIPTGEIRPVEGTPLDFRTPTAIGARINDDYEPLRFAGGYDQNWILNKDKFAAEVYEPSTGIVMQVITDQPGIQFYSGNFMNGKDTGKYGDKHTRRSGLALETQNFPDAPNHDNFPSAILRPGGTYTQCTIYKFSTK